jgi:hypothetical protein
MEVEHGAERGLRACPFHSDTCTLADRKMARNLPRDTQVAMKHTHYQVIRPFWNACIVKIWASSENSSVYDVRL